MKVEYIGQWQFPDKVIRLFNLHLPSGEVPTFAVGPGEDLKTKMAQVQQKFSSKAAA